MYSASKSCTRSQGTAIRAGVWLGRLMGAGSLRAPWTTLSRCGRRKVARSYERSKGTAIQYRVSHGRLMGAGLHRDRGTETADCGQALPG